MIPALYVMIKPVSGNCNLRCTYCFYADEMRHREVASYGRMEEKTMEELIRRSLAEAEHQVTFAFQGGEPTLAGLPFYRQFAVFAEKYRKPGNVYLGLVHRLEYVLMKSGNSSWQRIISW